MTSPRYFAYHCQECGYRFTEQVGDVVYTHPMLRTSCPLCRSQQIDRLSQVSLQALWPLRNIPSYLKVLFHGKKKS